MKYEILNIKYEKKSKNFSVVIVIEWIVNIYTPRILVLGFYVARRTFKALVIIIGTVHPYYLITFWLAIEVWSTTITIIRNS